MAEYQTGIQLAVYEAVKQGKELGLPYVSKQQIIDEVSRVIPLKKPGTQVGQALYQLQHDKKYIGPKIKHVKGGWTLVDDSEIHKIKAYDKLHELSYNVLEEESIVLK